MCLYTKRKRACAHSQKRHGRESTHVREKARAHARARECHVPLTSSYCEVLIFFGMRCLYFWLEAAPRLALRCMDVCSIGVDVPCVTRRMCL